jgi:parvulin-like peptidyl-prolyl isomerase
MAKNPKKKIVTKKHLARLDRERLQTRYILIASALVLLVVVLMVGYGFIEQYILQPNQPVAIVNGDEIGTREFQVNVRFSRQQLITQYIQTQQFMELLGGDEANKSFFEQNLQQIRLQLDSPILAQNVLDRLIEDRLIRQEADDRGIIVTKDEIDQAIQADFSYFPEGTPTPTSTVENIATSTLSPTQLALIPSTPTATSTPTLQTDESPTPTINPTPTSTQAPTPSPTVYTMDAFQENYQSYIDFLSSELDMSEADLRDIYESELYRDKVFQLITADVEEEQEQVWARHILVEVQSTAQEVNDRLQAGEDFFDLAAEYSVDASNSNNGGDLGWFGIGRMDPEFEKVAFNLSIGQISEPFETSFGWHIVQVLGHETKPLSAAEYQQLQQTEFNNWLDTLRNEADIQIFDYWTERVPTRPALPPVTNF